MSKNPVVYTGAVVFLEQYNANVHCDLCEIAGAVLIYPKKLPWTYRPDRQQRDEVTHTLADPRGEAYVSPDKRVIMAPSVNCLGPRR